jgi:2-haloacid dehalogenase
MKAEVGRAGSWVHVACSAFHDIPPANRLGARTVWVRREQTEPAPSLADAVLDDLARLPQVLRSLAADR